MILEQFLDIEKNEHMQIVLECFEMCLKCVGVKKGRAVMIF